MKAGANAAARARRAVQTLPDVTISEDSEVRFLHLGTEWIQGSMLLESPFDIELDYVQRMMAWLLFVDPDSVPKRRALQLGLGSAALTKFCFKKLRMDTTAIEINPQVVAVCRQWFKLPADGPRLRVLLADAGEEIRRADHVGAYDALQVDLYDHEAAARARQPRLLRRLPRRAHRRRLPHRQPLRPRRELRALAAKHLRRLRVRRGLGLQAHARRQHRGAGPTHRRAAHPHGPAGARGSGAGALGFTRCEVAAPVQTGILIDA